MDGGKKKTKGKSEIKNIKVVGSKGAEAAEAGSRKVSSVKSAAGKRTGGKTKSRNPNLKLVKNGDLPVKGDFPEEMLSEKGESRKRGVSGKKKEQKETSAETAAAAGARPKEKPGKGTETAAAGVPKKKKKKKRSPQKKKISKEKLSEKKLSEKKSSEGKLSEGKFPERRLSEGKLSEERLSEGKFSEERLSEGKLSERRLSGERLSEGKLSEEGLSGEKDSKKKLSDGKLSKKRLSKENFPGEKLSKKGTLKKNLSEEKLSQKSSSKKKLSEGKVPKESPLKKKVSKGKFIKEKPSKESFPKKLSSSVASRREDIGRGYAERPGIWEWFIQHKSLIIIWGTIGAVIAAIVTGYWFVVTNYEVTTVYVDGNIHYSNEEIMDMVMTGPYGNNSLYLSMKYKDMGVENVPFVEKMDVNILTPDTIRISVYEKALAGYVEYLGRYMYFDKDGIVVESSKDRTAGIPQVTGLEFGYVILNEPLPVENDAVFKQILNITQLLDKYELTADKIYFDSDYDLTLFFGGIRVTLGTGEDLDKKIMRLQYILPELEGKKGTLPMEKYTEDTKVIPFRPD